MDLRTSFTIPNSQKRDMWLHYTKGRDKTKPLIFKIHGLASFSDSPHNALIRQILEDLGFSIVEVDATNSNNNKSGGELKEFTIGQHTEDLQYAIQWVEQNEPGWLTQKFGLAGHSMGGIAVLETAAQMAEKIAFVMAFSSVISGEQFKNALTPDALAAWKKEGLKELAQNDSRKIAYVPWDKAEEFMTHDIQKDAHKLTMPVLCVVGKDDEVTPYPDVEDFTKLLTNPKNQTILIPGADHCFLTPPDKTLAEKTLRTPIHDFVNILEL